MIGSLWSLRLQSPHTGDPGITVWNQPDNPVLNQPGNPLWINRVNLLNWIEIYVRLCCTHIRGIERERENECSTASMYGGIGWLIDPQNFKSIWCIGDGPIRVNNEWGPVGTGDLPLSPLYWFLTTIAMMQLLASKVKNPFIVYCIYDCAVGELSMQSCHMVSQLRGTW